MSGLLVSDRHENIDTLFADHHQHTYIYLIVKGKSWASRSIATIVNVYPRGWGQAYKRRM